MHKIRKDYGGDRYIEVEIDYDEKPRRIYSKRELIREIKKGLKEVRKHWDEDMFDFYREAFFILFYHSLKWKGEKTIKECRALFAEKRKEVEEKQRKYKKDERTN